MKFLSLLCIFLFAGLWGFCIKKLLPNEIADGNNNKFDERESRILLEVFSNTLVWVVYALLFSLLIKITGLADFNKMLFVNYQEIGYLIIILALFLTNYFYIKRKYTVKG